MCMLSTHRLIYCDVGLPGGRGQAVKQRSIDQASCFKDPVRAMESILKTLAQANASQRVDLDWEAQNQVHASHILASYAHTNTALTI